MARNSIKTAHKKKKGDQLENADKFQITNGEGEFERQ